MFINVAIAPEAVEAISNTRKGLASGLLRKHLFELINKYGAITQPSNDSAKALVDALCSPQLTQSEQVEWREFLVYLRTRHRFSAAKPDVHDFWDRVPDVASYQSMSDTSSVLNVITEESYMSMFSDDAGLHRLSEEIEIATPATASLSASAQKLGSLVEEGMFAKGTSREQVWRLLLSPLAESSRQIVIFDPYLYYNLWKESSEPRPRKEHMEWLLERIDGLRPGSRTVTLIGAAGDGVKNNPSKQPEQVLRLLEDHFAGAFPNISEVRAYVVPTRRQMHHDRHVWFNSGQAVELPSGFDRLSFPELRDGMSFTFRYVPQSLQVLERRASDAQESRGTVWSQVRRY